MYIIQIRYVSGKVNEMEKHVVRSYLYPADLRLCLPFNNGMVVNRLSTLLTIIWAVPCIAIVGKITSTVAILP